MNATHTQLDADEFRRKLANLSAGAGSATDSTEQFRRLAVDLALFLAEQFGDDLDRLTLWTRIDSAIATAASKEPTGGVGFADAALEHVKAEPGRVACSDLASSVYNRLDAQHETDTSEGVAWVQWIMSRRYVVITQARAARELAKETQ